MSCSHQVNKNHQQRCNALTTWPVVGAALTTPVSHAPQATWCVTCEMAWHILYAASADNPGCITPSLNIVHTLATLAFWTSFRRNLLHPDILPWQCQTHILRLRACHRKQTSLRRSRASQLQDLPRFSLECKQHMSDCTASLQHDNVRYIMAFLWMHFHCRDMLLLSNLQMVQWVKSMHA